MLEDGELALDAVHVLLPPDLHARAAPALIERSLHVLLEKPIAITAKECSELIEQATARGVMIGVNHNFLFAPTYENLKDDLKSGKIGRPDHVTITWNRGLDQLQSGPFSLWMLRDPRNIILEIRALVAAVDMAGVEGGSFNLVAETDLTAFDYLKALEEHAGVSFQKFPTPPWKFYAVDLVKWAVKQMVRHSDQRRPSYRDWESRTQRAHYDCTKARRLLNWNPVSDRDEIIRRGIQLPGSEFLV